MKWIELTQASTGVEVQINMDKVVMISRSRTGGANLMLSFVEATKPGGRETARMISVLESSEEIMKKLAE